MADSKKPQGRTVLKGNPLGPEVLWEPHESRSSEDLEPTRYQPLWQSPSCRQIRESKASVPVITAHCEVGIDHPAGNIQCHSYTDPRITHQWDQQAPGMNAPLAEELPDHPEGETGFPLRRDGLHQL
jgi:hypothetical protein